MSFEIECRFLEINKEELIQKLQKLGALDKGETVLEEIIFYDKDLEWKTGNKFVRLRKQGEKIKLTYKEHNSHSVDGAYEIEFEVNDLQKAEIFLEKIGLRAFRHQQKKRHSFELNGVTFDIDTWPQIPTYVELEGGSETALQNAAEAVGFSWQDAEFHDAAWVIEDIYKIPVRTLTWFTFDRVE